MSYVARLAGALLVHSGAEYYLVGYTKTPCDWIAAGFEPPSTVETTRPSWTRLSATRAVELAPPRLALDVEGEAAARLIAERMLVARTGSVSERLWRLCFEADADQPVPAQTVTARWLAELPLSIWRIVTDTVLRCS